MNTLKNLLIVLVIFVASTAVAKTGKLEETKTTALEVVIQEQKGDRVLVGLEKNAADVVKIKIYNEKGLKVYSEKVKSGTLMLKRFDVSQLPAGDYSYEVSNEDYTVEKVITK